jgi:hypothetical protein
MDPKWGKPGPTHDPVILANFTPRPTDVLITTAPKAGTTWMQQILHQLRSGGDVEFFSIGRVVPWLELPRPGKSVDEVLADYEALEDPRIFKTHCTYKQTPGVDTARIILTSRDPRDCCVSFYHHVMDMTEAARQQAGLKLYRDFETFFEDWLAQASWYRNVAGWWPQRKRDNLLWLRFEDMKADLPGAIDRIIEFLGWDISAVQRTAAIEYSSFDWMKQHADKFTRQLSSDEPVFKPGGFIRKGTTGDYKTKLSAEQEARVLAKARELLTDDCLEFLQIAEASN